MVMNIHKLSYKATTRLLQQLLADKLQEGNLQACIQSAELEWGWSFLIVQENRKSSLSFS